jgi:transcriptional regulator with XRE-family HTH domain
MDLAALVDVTFQQVQKYENGANRVSASRLWQCSKELDIPISAFFKQPDEEAEATYAEMEEKSRSAIAWMRLYSRLSPAARQLMANVAEQFANLESRARRTARAKKHATTD